MVTGNGSASYSPPLESDLAGRRKITHRLDPLKIEHPRAARTALSSPSPSRSPRSPHSPPNRSLSPLPPSATGFDDRPWLPESLRAGSPGPMPDDWPLKMPGFGPQLTPPKDRNALNAFAQENCWDRQSHRQALPARGGLRISMSTSRLQSRRPRFPEPEWRQNTNPYALPPPRFPPNGLDDDTLRASVNSTLTSRSSIEQNSGTERSSVLTKSSSITDLSPDTPDTPCGLDEGMSVEDAISMYLDGFSDVTEEPASPRSRLGSKAASIVSMTPPPSRDTHLDFDFPLRSTSLDDVPPIPRTSHSRQEPVLWESTPEYLTPEFEFEPETPFSEPTPEHSADALPPQPIPSEFSTSPTTSNVQAAHQRQPSKIFIPGPVPPPLISGNDARDMYGFRKATHHVTLEQYEAWKGPYSHYTAQRKDKWMALLNEHGLPTTNPSTFPAPSNKVKRFVRKGIPGEFRGAAWFWYAGGYQLLNGNFGVYDQLVEKAMASESDDDKEHIERDLHRTFPDNIHFKPDPVETGSPNDQQGNVTTETQMIQSLRRVLYAFALHNPKIGYTQSLNFITGMLLLFLPEEKTFWMLHIITSVYLPGTHEISLEGANIDLWILMVLLRDSMPATYTKIASMGGTSGHGKSPPLTVNSRLPDITLGLTNWLMSVFIGTLPLETTLRVWDIFFYEGSKTFFRVSLGIFKACERDIIAVSDPMEVFQVVQTVPKKLLDANALLEDCFVRRHRVGQGRIDDLRAARRTAVRQEKLRRSAAWSKGEIKPSATDDLHVNRRKEAPGIEHRVADSWRHLKSHAFR
ncbi:hypothetical protein N7495_007862 [Penicillium taxi]|uniref:uncharacterized protein n=1 Tax=Penicillium taxi TaxID=168475 RepID=UPI002544EAB4|nr:uncharacterized protein N7495_007862 [Penicillium taxi]KAJ5887821.1 hypothetical protein N7495_007862 [Penicillium taxi]